MLRFSTVAEMCVISREKMWEGMVALLKRRVPESVSLMICSWSSKVAHFNYHNVKSVYVALHHSFRFGKHCN